MKPLLQNQDLAGLVCSQAWPPTGLHHPVPPSPGQELLRPSTALCSWAGKALLGSDSCLYSWQPHKPIPERFPPTKLTRNPT
jgi:hypothetical protein